MLFWIVFGGIAGWIASKFTGNDASMGIFLNILVGIIGSAIGGWLGTMFGFGDVTGFNLSSFIIAVIGSVIFLSIVNFIRR